MQLYEQYKQALKHPKYKWLVIGLTLVYLISPIDLIPDVFLGLGQVDDAAIILMLVTELFRNYLDKNKGSESARGDTVDAEFRSK
jgi:uncharacterized membrane protein YkvA (DUF1232 family)